MQGYYRVIISVKAKERRYTMIGVTRYQLERAKIGLQLIIFMVFTAAYRDCLVRNLNASKPPEHPIKSFWWEHRLPRQDLFMVFNRISR